MEKAGVFTKILAVLSTVLVWLPILATIVTAIFGSIRAGVFRFDYLMPAELSPLALMGGILLLWVALRAKLDWRLIAGSLAGMILFLFGSQALAVVTGLASGANEPEGWRWILVLALLAAYVLSSILCALAGMFLVGLLFRRPK